ncbi:phosphatidate cytidylyltransferase [Clostridium sp. 'deep sea']|uniref:phosphatidate cytidylyltransferase n=1 Tax=Clostridium sp. 'deep sea' TaxID=2779445 RepID=UPI0018963F9D|nr:phosphatidate cytidylyltransferase [Clostridium sp. 'deep sea']QOR36027.1 phosphatidate cytidylyltransferase [Clostridium sp. 'deep sea']
MKKRIMSAIVAVPILLYIVLKGGIIFDIAWFLVLSILLFELNRMVAGKLDIILYLPSLLYLVTSYANYYYNWGNANLIASFFIIIMLIINIIVVRKHNLSKISLAIIGSLYIIFLGMYLFMLADISQALLIISFITAWAYDSCAYFTGVKWGRRRPWPELSPKKSIEGVMGGAVGTVLVVLLFASINNWNLVNMAIYALFAVFLAQCGDLIESSIKRFCSVKDSGKILPGHGGFLDRFDSVLPILPLTYLIFVVLKLQ